MTITMPDIWKYTDGTIRLAFVSDVQSGAYRQVISELVASWNPNAVITSGDNAEGAAWSDFTTPYAYWLNRSDLFPVLGNHDLEAFGGGIDYGTGYFAAFPVVNNSYYYQLDLGPITFFMLDSTEYTPDGHHSGQIQDQWFQRVSQASNATWKVANFHHAPYTSSNHSGDTWMRWDYSEMDLVLSGHVHMYERLLVDDIPYIVNGSAGKTHLPPVTILPQSLVRYWAEYGAMLWEVSPTKLVAQFRNEDNAVVDELILEK